MKKTVFGITMIAAIEILCGSISGAETEKSETEATSATASYNSDDAVTECYTCSASSEDSEIRNHSSLQLIIRRDFRMPTVVIGVLLKNKDPDISIKTVELEQLIASNLINKDIQEKLRKLGVEIEISCQSCGHIEISAVMRPQKLHKFLDIIKDVTESFSVDSGDLAYQKKQILIDNELSSCDGENSIENNLLARYMPQAVFNESWLNLITVDDINQYFENHYKNSTALITIFGDVDWVPTAEEKVQLAHKFCGIPAHHDCIISATQDSADNATSATANTVVKKFTESIATAPKIFIENQYMGRSLNYFYFIYNEDDKRLAKVLSDLIRYEMRQNLYKNNAVLRRFSVGLSLERGGNIVSVSMLPRSDISLRQLDIFYTSLIRKISVAAPQKEMLEKIARREEESFNILQEDLNAFRIFAEGAYLSGHSDVRFSPVQTLKSADPEEARKFAEKILNNQVICKITTRYKPSR